MSNKKIAVQGAKWTTISTTINTLFQFAQVAVIARFLLPSAFGIVSISTLVINFLNIFAHFGFSNSIIHKQESDRKVLSTIYYFNIVIGILMFIIIYISIPLLISFYKEPRLQHVLEVAAYYFPIVFLGQIYNTLLEKELRFKQLAIIDIFCSVFSTTITIILAYKDYQEMSLMYGTLAGQLLRMILLNITARDLFSPVRYFNLKEIKEHLLFGIYNTGDNIVGFANANIDSILIGGMLGVKELGYYTVASQIAIFPIIKICPVITQTCYPIMAKMKGNIDGLKSAFLQISDLITYLTIPLLGGLYIMAINVIPILYGPHWGESIPLIKIFVFVSLMSSVTFPLSPLVFTFGKPNLLFYQSLVGLAFRFPIIFFFAKYYGVMGVAVGYLISSLLAVGFAFFIVQHLVGAFAKKFLRNISKPLIFCLAMITGILFYRHFVTSTGMMNTIIQIIIGGIIYVLLTLKFKMSVKDFIELRKSL